MDEQVVIIPKGNQIEAKKMIRSGNRLFLWIPIVQIIALIILEYYGVKGLDEVITLLGFVGIPLLYTQLKLNGNFKEVFKLNPINLKAVLPLVLITIAIQPISTFLFMVSTVLFGNHMDTLFQVMLTQGPLMLFLSLCVIPAIGEEFIMRGIILHTYGPMKGYTQVIINGFLFGLFHQNLNQFSYSCLIGMVLALVVVVTKSIWSGVIIHFLNNFLAYLEYEFDFTLLNDAINQPMNWAVVIGLGVVAVFVLFKLIEWLNAIYREESLNAYMTGEDERWVMEKECNKLSWTSMWTGSMIGSVIIFIIFSIVIMLVAAKILVL